jgi:hypothetical protein
MVDSIHGGKSELEKNGYNDNAADAAAGSYSNSVSVVTTNSATQTTQQQIHEAASICKSMINVDTHLSLIPLLSSNCQKYIACDTAANDGSVMQYHTCPDDLLFDVAIQICNWQDRVDCPQYVEVVPAAQEEKTEKVDEEEMQWVLNVNDLFDFESTDQQELETSATPSSSSTYPPISNTNIKPNKLELSTICTNKAVGLFPLLTTQCKDYVTCFNGQVSSTQRCADNLLFDVSILGCNWADQVKCNDDIDSVIIDTQQSSSSSSSSATTTEETTIVTTNPLRPQRPTASTTKRPTTASTTKRPTTASSTEQSKTSTTTVSVAQQLQQPPPTSSKQQDSSSTTGGDTSIIGRRDASAKVYEWLSTRKQQLNDQVFQSTTMEGVNYRSYWFQYNDFIKALQVSNGNGSITGVPKHTFYLGNKEDEWEYGLVNIAAFLAHAMTISITFDACDEFHSDKNTDVDAAKGGSDQFYAISNSCGQYGFNYQDYQCREDERHMECAVKKNMNLQATTSPIYPNAPPPFTCRPRNVSESFSGYWDVKTGKEMVSFPYKNSYGRTDIESCCYWGRGALHTRGICNIGKLNYYLGKKVSSVGGDVFCWLRW